MNRIISVRNPKSPIAEAYRGIRTSIEFSNLDKELKVINVTSSTQNEGKSTRCALFFFDCRRKTVFTNRK